MINLDYNDLLGLNTIIPTTKGYKTIKTITVGDIIFGLDNKLSKVIAVYDIIKTSKTYKLVFSNSFYEFTIVSDEIHSFPVITRLRTNINDISFFKPVTCKDLSIGDAIFGGNRDFILTKKTKIKSQPIKCITIDSNEHIFKIVNEINPSWTGGTDFNLPSLYMYDIDDNM